MLLHGICHLRLVSLTLINQVKKFLRCVKRRPRQAGLSTSVGRWFAATRVLSTPHRAELQLLTLWLLQPCYLLSIPQQLRCHLAGVCWCPGRQGVASHLLCTSLLQLHTMKTCWSCTWMPTQIAEPCWAATCAHRHLESSSGNPGLLCRCCACSSSLKCALCCSVASHVLQKQLTAYLLW